MINDIEIREVLSKLEHLRSYLIEKDLNTDELEYRYNRLVRLLRSSLSD